MFEEISFIDRMKALTQEQIFLLIFFLLSLLLSFAFGYIVFRYWRIEVCKLPMEVTGSDLQVFTEK